MKKILYFLAAIFIFVAVVWAGTTHFRSHLCPQADDTYNLGSSSLEWKDIHIDGTLNADATSIDTLTATDADINGSLWLDVTTLAQSDFNVGNGTVTLTATQSGYIVVTATATHKVTIIIPSTGTITTGTAYTIQNVGDWSTAPRITLDVSPVANATEKIENSETNTDMDACKDIIGIFSVDGVGWLIEERRIQ